LLLAKQAKQAKQQKGADFLFFEQIVELMNKGAHLTINGLQQVINIRASIAKQYRSI
jgi:hypothetical protein